jgi:uncharacterized SAM-binding protein YcdF (DUF218 family)
VKQFVAPLAEPLGAIWLFMALCVLLLLWRRRWRSALWLGVPTLLLFMVGSTSLAEVLVAREESRYAGASVRLETEHGRKKTESNDADGTGEVSTDTATQRLNGSPPADAPSPVVTADAVVALGGGVSISHYDSLGFAVRDGGNRMLAAVKLVRLGKAKTLILGGSCPLPGKPGVPSMSVVQDWVVSWRVINGEVTNLGICINTHDEAVAFRKLEKKKGWKKVLLVTSALHMRRSEALFRKQGVDVVPVAADFEVYGVPHKSAFNPFPRMHRFILLALYLHEKIGWWVYRWRGWV